MSSHRFPDQLALVLRVILGAWFTYSGGEKIFGSGLSAFTQAVTNYRLISAPWNAAVAYTLPWFEIAAGFCLLAGVLTRGALLLVAGMTLIFLVAVTYAWSQGLDIACGCRGSDTPMVYSLKFLELGAYLLAVAWIWWRERATASATAI